MADNVNVTQGTGTPMATDEVAGVHYPRVKLSVGADGAAADVHAGNPMPVDVKSLPSGLATDAKLDALLTELGQKLEPSDIAGLATSAKQDALLAELSQKLEPADIAGLLKPSDIVNLATSAKQNDAITAIQSVRDRLSSVTQVEPELTMSALPTSLTYSVAGSDFVKFQQTANGQDLFALSLDPLSSGTVSMITAPVAVATPHSIEAELSISQRVRGSYFTFEAVNQSASAPGSLETFAIASISQATTTLTVVFSAPTTLSLGDFFSISGVSDNRLNYHNVCVATISVDGLTITATVVDDATIPSLTAGPYVSQGTATRLPHEYGASNFYGIRYTGTSSTSAAILSKFDTNPTLIGATFNGSQLTTVSSSAPIFAGAATGNYDVKPTSRLAFRLDTRGLFVSDGASDSAGSMTARAYRTSVKPSNGVSYKVRIRGVNPISLTRPVAKIAAASKAGSTTATITTTTPHGLSTGQYVNIKGIRDQTNFVTTTVPIQITVTSTTQFTVAFGASATATSYGGAVILANGLNDQPGYNSSSTIQTVARDASGYVTLVGSASWTAQVGEFYNLYGVCDSGGTDLGVDGVYECVTVATTTLVLKPVVESLNGTTLAPTGAVISTTNCGGALILRQTIRVHELFAETYKQSRVQIEGQGSTDLTKAIPAVLATSPSVIQGTAATISSTDGSGGWFVRPGIVGITDVASAALTTSSTTAAIANNLGSAFQIAIPVTAVTGTSPTLDVRIEESHDGGTNWIALYEFERITATGYYISPMLRAGGRHIRYVQTVAGTTPSFTRSVSRTLWPFTPADRHARRFDRAISLTTLNATTATLFTGAATNAQLVLNLGAATTPPVMKLQGSDDGTNWYDLSATTLTGVASSTVQLTITNVHALFIRGIVSTAGATVTPGYVMIKAWN